MNSQILDFNFFLNTGQEKVFVNGRLLLSLSLNHLLSVFLVLSFVAIIDKIHVSNELSGMVAIYGNHTIKLLSWEMEINSGKDLAELFRGYFLMVMTVPVLEICLKIQPSWNTELSKSG